LNPDDPQSYYNRANAYYGKEEYQQAIKDFDEAIRLQPDYYDAYDNRGLAYGHMGEYARAVRDFGKATALDPNRPNAYFNRSTILARTGDYDGALKDLAQVIRLTPDDADTYYNRAIIYHRKGEDDRSIEDLDHAIRLNPDHAGAYYNRGLAYSGKHDYDRAIQDFSQAIRLRPNDADGYYNRGVNYDDKGDYDLAIQDFDQAFRLRPKDLGIDLSWDVGRAFFGLARFPDATEVLAVSARAHPKDAYVVLWLYLARQRSHAGGGQELNAEAKNLELDKWPGPIVRYYQGLISKEATLTAAADPNPNTAGRQNCEVAFYIGEVALIAGRTAEAKTSFRHALDICASGSVELGGTKAELGRLESW
jgi:tetratricopeptide (TPR) repeat protein